MLNSTNFNTIAKSPSFKNFQLHQGQLPSPELVGDFDSLYKTLDYLGDKEQFLVERTSMFGGKAMNIDFNKGPYGDKKHISESEKAENLKKEHEFLQKYRDYSVPVEERKPIKDMGELAKMVKKLNIIKDPKIPYNLYNN